MNTILTRTILLVLAFGLNSVVFAAAPPGGPAAKGIDTSPTGGAGATAATTRKCNQIPDLFASVNTCTTNNTATTNAIVEWVYTLSTGNATPIK